MILPSINARILHRGPRNVGLGTLILERDGSWTTFKRDGVGVTAPVVSHWTGTTTTDITPGIGQKVGSTKTYNHNGLKSVEAQSQSASSLSSTRVYDAWGAVVSSTGTHAGRFGHGGAYGYQSDSNDLQLLGHRFYDPNAGRFLTRDRIKDGRNWYAYCDNNPLTFADENGLEKKSIRDQIYQIDPKLGKRYDGASKEQKERIHRQIGDEVSSSDGVDNGSGISPADQTNPDVSEDILRGIAEENLGDGSSNDLRKRPREGRGKNRERTMGEELFPQRPFDPSRYPVAIPSPYVNDPSWPKWYDWFPASRIRIPLVAVKRVWRLAF